MEPNEIEIEHRCYCEENGYFCQFLDKKSGFCIATSCKRMIDLMEQEELEKKARLAIDSEEEKFWLEHDDLFWGEIGKILNEEIEE